MEHPITWSETKEFLWSICTDWLALMSGAFSVPFTFISTYASSVYTKIIFSSLAILALLFSAFRVWHNKNLCIQMLKVEKSGLEERALRLTGCTGYLRSVTSKWKNFTHQPINLTFAPAENVNERVFKTLIMDHMYSSTYL